MKNTINMKVLEVAIRKKDFTFLARNLVKHLYEADWTSEDVTEFIEKLESANRHVD